MAVASLCRVLQFAASGQEKGMHSAIQEKRSEGGDQGEAVRVASEHRGIQVFV
jgi:hypothetical protein